jgi:chromosome segregation ATPase
MIMATFEEQEENRKFELQELQNQIDQLDREIGELRGTILSILHGTGSANELLRQLQARQDEQLERQAALFKEWSDLKSR